MLVVAIGAGWAVLDAECDRLAVDRTDEFVRFQPVAFTARECEILAVDGAGRVASAFEVVNPVAVGADGSQIVAVVIAVDRLGIAGKADWQPNILGSHDALISVAFAAGLGDFSPADEAFGIIGMCDVMPGVAIGAGGSRPVAMEPCQSVDACPVISLNGAVAGAAAERLRLSGVGDLMGAVA